MRVALIGLPGVGKTVIFNTVTKYRLDRGSHPIPTLKPSRRDVTVHDSRMALIAEKIMPSELFPLQMQFLDTAGVELSSVGDEAQRSETLGLLREADAIAHVLGNFELRIDDGMERGNDVLRDASRLEEWLINVDLVTVTQEMSRRERTGQMVRQRSAETRLGLEEVGQWLSSGRSLRETTWPREIESRFDEIGLVTQRPQIYIQNVGEELVERHLHNVTVGLETVRGCPSGTMFGQLEYEFVQLPDDERGAMAEIYPSFHTVAEMVPWWAIHAMKVNTYFTFGRLGLKEWAMRQGSTAVDAAKRLHSDIAKGLVATEVVKVSDLLAIGSADAVRKSGKMRIEGRDYQVEDGDILYFRFAR